MRPYRSNHGEPSRPAGFDSSMGNSSSQIPTISPHHNKLTKPRNIERPYPKRLSSMGPHYTPQLSEPHVRTNYESLKDLESRHALRQPLTSTFSEAKQNVTRDSNIGVDLSSFTASYRRSRASFEVMSNHSAKSSIDSNDGKLATLQEHAGMDVGAAINLLQELKKNATPEELVALHKALLPTREVQPSTARISNQPPQLPGFDRERTALIPGLATRGGPEDDVLRRQGDMSGRSQRQTNTTSEWGQPVFNDVARRPAPLKLARKSTNSSDPHIGHTGSFLPGSLRIANGTDSPSPETRRRRSIERVVSPITLDQRGDGGSISSSDGRPSEDYKPSPVMDRFPLPAYDHSQQIVPGRDGYQSHASQGPPNHQNLHYNQFQQQQQHPISSPLNPAANRIPSQSTPEPRFTSTVDQPHEHEQDTPRAQRIRPRRNTAASIISAISQDYLDHCDIPTTPFEEIPDLPTFSSRISSEINGEGNNNTEETRADAYSILNGSSSRSMQHPHLRGRQGAVANSDSGYGSDSSYRSLNRQTSDKTSSSSNRRPSGSTFDKSSTFQSDVDSTTPLEDALKATPADETAPAPSMNTKGKKRMTLLRSLTSKNASALGLEDLSTSTEAQSTSGDFVKSQPDVVEARKLKKPLPPPPIKSSKNEGSMKDFRSKSVPDLSLHMSSRQSLDQTRLQPSEEVREKVRARSPSTTPTKTLFHFGNRDRSRGRQRSSTVETKDDTSHDVRKASYGSETEQSRGRSKSRKRRSLGMFLNGKDHRKSQSPATTDPSEDEVAGAGPFDIPTSEAKRRSQVARDMSSQNMPNGLFKTKSYTGMSEEMAAQLARMKSKDRAGRDFMPEYDHPRMARPDKKKKEKRSQSQPRLPDRRVEDFIPGWQAVSRAPQPPQAQQKPPMPHRPHSVQLDSIPPMPDMPANAQKKALRADRLVADKIGTSPRASPDPSGRSSFDNREQMRAVSPRPSRSPVGKREDLQSEPEPELEPKKNGGWKTVRDPALNEQKVKGLNAEVRSSPLPSPTASTSGAESDDQRKPRQQSLPTDAYHVGTRKRATSAKPPRERRNTRDHVALPSKAVDTHSAQQMRPREPSKSPSIVVSRYITPHGQDAGHAISNERPTDAARQHADLYMDLLHTDHETHPSVALPTRNDSGISASSKQASDPIFHDKVYEAKGDGSPKAKLPEPTPRPGRNGWITHTAIPPAPPPTRQPRQPRPESLSRLNGPFQANEFEMDDFEVYELEAPLSPQSLPQKGEEQVPDRYGGGLGYRWDRESRGITGSAGTHHNSRPGSSKKSVKLSEDWGLDLSDVPVFLKKT